VRDWFSWGSAVVLAVHKCQTEEELAPVVARIEPNLPGYRKWSPMKAAQLGTLIAIVRYEVKGK
jgi:hypothetical protein